MEFRETLVRAGKRLLEKKLTVETWGNLSLRDPAMGLVYITPSAMAYDRISPEDVVVMTLSGERVAGERKPTVETALHLGIYGARPEICAIVHTHPVQSLVFACLHEDIPPVIDEAAQSLGGTVRCAAYALPGTKALAQNALAALGKDGMACLLANHGAVCLGRDMDEAFRTAAVLEMTAEVYRMARTLGTPKPVSAENAAYLREFMLHRYFVQKD